MNFFCKHEWKILHTTPIYYKDASTHTYWHSDGSKIGEVVVCTCTKCGKIKKFTNN